MKNEYMPSLALCKLSSRSPLEFGRFGSDAGDSKLLLRPKRKENGVTNWALIFIPCLCLVASGIQFRKQSAWEQIDAAISAVAGVPTSREP